MRKKQLMNTRPQLGLILPLLLVGGLAAPQAASAQTEVGGTSTVTTLPFGTDGSTSSNTNYAGEYQQIYSASAFTAPINITQISFASAPDPSGAAGSSPETATYKLIVGFSNTSASISAPSFTYSDNIGSNFKTVFSGTIVAQLQANNTFDLNIPLTAVFAYDPSLAGQQNLLLDVFIQSATSTDKVDFFQSGDDGQTGRVYNSDGTSSFPTASDQNGLRTLFTVTPAPEPSPLLSLLLGIGGVALIGGLQAKKRRSLNS